VFIGFLYFLAMYLIAGTLIRLVTMTWPDNAVSRALIYAH
jgi:hypothetical protein